MRGEMSVLLSVGTLYLLKMVIFVGCSSCCINKLVTIDTFLNTEAGNNLQNIIAAIWMRANYFQSTRSVTKWQKHSCVVCIHLA
jgi:hypothetical protein